MYLFTRKKLVVGRLNGRLATLTRQQGIFLLIPVVELWEESDRKVKRIAGKWRNWLALILIPTGYILWIVSRFSCSMSA
jgi:Gpi18-like mannosyltransferase